MADDRVPDITAVASPPQCEIKITDLNIGKQLGTGGHAVVHEARLPDRPEIDRLALKEPWVRGSEGTLNQHAVEQFLREAENWAEIDQREREKHRWRHSEHFVGVIDVGDRQPWIAMEYMDAGSLDERLEGADGLPLDEALWIGECLCSGLEIAHSLGIAHLDLKPANVLFRETPDDQWNVPKISDWGLARTLVDETGTMEMMS